ncbi:MAG: mechanosensitive ion channel [Candidatus Omnitrophica bacterium]|nr:mechanosensitive ion channel [Candidatus Omnitrophota bacterium]
MNEFFGTLLQWINTPIIYIGGGPVTLGGITSGLFVFLFSLVISGVVRRLIAIRLKKSLHFSDAMTYAFQRIAHYTVIVLGLILATQFIGINLGSLTVMFGFLGVGIGFGLQNLTSNFISGLILLIERPVGVGDFISIEDKVGIVSNVNMRATVINTLDNVSIIVPNAKFIENQVTNWAYGDTRVRIHCPVGVAYGSDIPKVKETLLAVARNHPDVLDTPAPDVWFLRFGNSSLDFDLLIWTEKPEKQYLLRSQINYAIDESFRREKITVPFPQQDVHVQLTPAIDRLAGNK